MLLIYDEEKQITIKLLLYVINKKKEEKEETEIL